MESEPLCYAAFEGSQTSRLRTDTYEDQVSSSTSSLTCQPAPHCVSQSIRLAVIYLICLIQEEFPFSFLNFLLEYS